MSTNATLPTITVVKAGRKWEVHNNGEVTATLKTKGEAEAEATQQREDATTPAADPAEVFAALVANRTERIAAAKAERNAVKAWKDAGSEGDAPATPVLDWMNATTPAEKKQAERKPRTTGGGKTHTPEQKAEIEKLVAAGRAAGRSWAKIGESLTEAGIPTVQGGPWAPMVVRAWGLRLGLDMGQVAKPAPTPEPEAPKGRRSRKAAA